MRGLRKSALLLILALALLCGCGREESELYDRGMQSLEDGDPAIAAAMFEGAVKAQERLCESYRGLGIALMQSGDYAGAAEAFRNSLTNMQFRHAEFSKDVMLYQAKARLLAGETEEAVAVYSRMLEEEEDADVYLARGRAYLAQREYDLAREDFDRAAGLFGSFEKCLEIYQLYQESSMRADGDRYLEMAVQYEPAGTEEYYALGCVYYYLEDTRSAAEALNRAIRAGSADALRLLGAMYVQSGSLSDARTLYQSCLEEEDFHAAACNGLALCDLAEGDTDGALEWIAEGLEASGPEEDRADLLYNQITVYEGRGDFARARDLVNLYLGEFPDDSEAAREQVFLASR